MRAKGAEDAVALFLTRDAVAPAALSRQRAFSPTSPKTSAGPTWTSPAPRGTPVRRKVQRVDLCRC